jgi:ethanolamine utilization protein EutA
MFSGGVGRLFYEEENNSDIDILTRYGDLGPALAICLKKRIEGLKARIIKPDETIYATVIGAGVHTTELSGSTIFVSDPRILPFRDLPAIRIDESNLNYAEDILKNILFKAKQFVTAESSRIPAVVVPKAAGNSFKKIKSLAEVLANAVKRLGKTGPLVVICEDDIGKALGSILKNMIGERPIVSIDQITMKEGDYIDIGEPLYNGGVVPVVIKTLVFSHS